MAFYDALSEIFPKLRPYKKALVAFVGASAPFVTYLVSGPHSLQEISGWSLAYVGTLFGVYESSNGPVA